MSVYFKFTGCRIVATVPVGLSYAQRVIEVTCTAIGARRTRVTVDFRAIETSSALTYRDCVGTAAAAADAVRINSAATKVE